MSIIPQETKMKRSDLSFKDNRSLFFKFKIIHVLYKSGFQLPRKIKFLKKNQIKNQIKFKRKSN